MTDSMNPTDALREMAGRVATQLVADALKAMVGAPVTVTLQPVVQAVRQLGPAPTKRRGRKPGPKPKGRPATTRKHRAPSKRGPWSAAQREKFRQTIAAKHGGPAVEKFIGRTVKQHRKAAAAPKEVRCSRCDHTEGEHDPQTGKCLSFRCACAGFWRK